MKKGIIGKKVGMTQIFDEVGNVIPVTVIETTPNTVVQIKTIEKDGYNAIQLGYGEIKDKHINKPEKGHFSKANLTPKKHLREFRVDTVDEVKVGLGKCLIVENPGVFANIIQDEELKEIPMVCTYGQVKLAGIILLRKLVEEGVELYYSGDIDPEGMQIADKLKKRFGNKLTLIGFDEETYKKNKSNVSLSEIRIKKLDGLKDAHLQETAELLKQDKVAAYEELNIDGLKKIVKKWRGED